MSKRINIKSSCRRTGAAEYTAYFIHVSSGDKFHFLTQLKGIYHHWHADSINLILFQRTWYLVQFLPDSSFRYFFVNFCQSTADRAVELLIDRHILRVTDGNIGTLAKCRKVSCQKWYRNIQNPLFRHTHTGTHAHSCLGSMLGWTIF